MCSELSSDDDGDELTPEQRIERLRAQLRELLGKKKANEIVRLIQQTNEDRIGSSSYVQIVPMDDVTDIITELWDEGIFGVGDADLLELDNYLSEKRNQHQVMLRIFKHYLEPDEYQAVLLALELNSIVLDEHAKVLSRPDMISGLYNRLDRLRYGRRIYNQVSRGWIFSTYRDMRRLETKLSPAGRCMGPEAESIKQIFYGRLQPNPIRYWVRSGDNVAEVLDEIVERLTNPDPSVDNVPFLDVYCAGRAREIARAAIQTFVHAYPNYEYEEEEQDDNPGASVIHIRRRRD